MKRQDEQILQSNAGQSGSMSNNPEKQPSELKRLADYQETRQSRNHGYRDVNYLKLRMRPITTHAFSK